MSYTALYRKFRPDHFADVKGQEHIVTTLQNQIRSGRVGHAYLFCGTRGTGKTTVAKLFAKTVNCQQMTDGNPCGTCISCRTIAAGAAMNVIEIDAASNNGVDNIREIIDEVSYSPAEGKYKVYIIDEVHMLSQGAFNALLKTLEEPPSYVIFILATTEVHKIPVTILSRCQRYDFKRISVDTITERLRELVAAEQMMVEERALRLIARMADGAMRDALSLLDQCAAFHFGEELTYENVLDVLGAVDTGVFAELYEKIRSKNILGCIVLLEEIVMQGRDLNQFVTDFIWYLRNLLLVKSSEGMDDIIEVSEENLKLLKQTAAQTETDAVIRHIRIFSELSNQIKFASQKRILIEIVLIKLCCPAIETEQDTLLPRIRDLEERLEKEVSALSLVAREGKREEYSRFVSDARADGADEQRNSGEGRKEIARQAAGKALAEAVPEEIRQIVSKWPGIIGRAGMPLKLYLKQTRPSLDNHNRLLLVVEDGIASDYLVRQEGGKEAVEQLIADYLGKRVEIALQVLDTGRSFEDSYIDLSKIINMEIEEEE